MKSRTRASSKSRELHLSPTLKHLVSDSVALLGEVIRRELGTSAYQRIEKLRQSMADLRGQSELHSLRALEKNYSQIDKLPRQQKHDMATAFTLMLQLMNTCENAYRSHRLNQRTPASAKTKPDSIVYVLTAHPTEARTPESIAIFHQIQNLLQEILDSDFASRKEELRHLLEMAWHIPLVRNRSPKVKDEADHIYSMLFRPEILQRLLSFSKNQVPLFIRTWVGGDKDGHPGVDEKTLQQSLQLSRNHLIRFCQSQLGQIKKSLNLMRLPSQSLNLQRVEKSFQALRTIKTGDGHRVQSFRTQITNYTKDYETFFGARHPALDEIKKILRIFPGLVVPLELRESSDILMQLKKHSGPQPRSHFAIERMMASLALISGGEDPRWYARSFIISMAESIEHIQAAIQTQLSAFGELRIPVVPLFEEASSLADSEKIVREMIQLPQIKKSSRQYWNRRLELMVGYSDSSKEAGVLPSRLGISEALPKIQKVCEQAGLSAVFFHGSGGSIDRGGGSIEDQTAWWPRDALKIYKVTVQGEMVERSLATPAIAERQLENIMTSVGHRLEQIKKTGSTKSPAVLDHFAALISEHYRQKISDPEFLKMVELATPYTSLSSLKIGSRPAKRSKTLSVSGLRAIPWILCWTQTRVLFPTWWSVGSAWEALSAQQKKSLRQAYRHQPVFTSYVKALGFTLAKVEPAIFRLGLIKSRLGQAEATQAYEDFENELKNVLRFYQEITGHKDLMWFRPWLGESIRLRSPMIHPLNILQIQAEKERDVRLLRLTVTGISSGMLTTG